MKCNDNYNLPNFIFDTERPKSIYNLLVEASCSLCSSPSSNLKRCIIVLSNLEIHYMFASSIIYQNQSNKKKRIITHVQVQILFCKNFIIYLFNPVNRARNLIKVRLVACSDRTWADLRSYFNQIVLHVNEKLF